MGIAQMGVDEMGTDEVGINKSSLDRASSFLYILIHSAVFATFHLIG